MMSVNCIADALEEMLPGRRFSVIVGSVNDRKFPVYVIHSVRLVEVSGTGAVDVLVKEAKVHSRNTDREQEISKLVSKLLVDLFNMFNGGSLRLSLPDIKY